MDPAVGTALHGRLVYPFPPGVTMTRRRGFDQSVRRDPRERRGTKDAMRRQPLTTERHPISPSDGMLTYITTHRRSVELSGVRSTETGMGAWVACQGVAHAAESRPRLEIYPRLADSALAVPGIFALKTIVGTGIIQVFRRATYRRGITVFCSFFLRRPC